MAFEAAILLIFPGAMAFAAAMDLFTMTIPNRISLVLVAGFFCLAPFTGMDLQTAALHVAAGVAMLVFGFGCFAMGWIGGGDAKLFAATSLWFGFSMALLLYIAFATLLGGALTYFILMMRGRPMPVLLSGENWVQRIHRADSGVPYGIALAAGALLAYPDSIWMTALAG